MVGSDEVAAGASLSAHFEAKRRILATVKHMEERGEKLEEATPEEIMEAADKTAQTVFRFDFSLNDDQEAAPTDETNATKRNRNRKKHKKRRGKKNDEKNAETTTNTAMTPVSQRSNGSENVKPQRVDDAAQSKPKATKTVGSSSFMKLRKATGTESEVAKMQLRMGCRHSKDDAVVGSTDTVNKRASRVSFRDDLTSDLIQHKYVDDINEYFDFCSTIGTGHFGCVKHAVSKKSGKEWAVKVVKLSNEVDKDALRNEINILKRLHHPQIVRVIGSYEDKEHMYMIMQLCKGKELYEHVYQDGRKFSEDDVRKIIRALLRALAFLHSNFITHRDLKLENLLLENADNPGSLRLCDFGLSTRFKRGEKLAKSLGTIDYVAPEVLDGDYNEKCDLWSVGVLCFELLTGVSPFHAATIDETMGNIYDGALIFENDVWSKFTPNAILFIKSLVKENVDQRLSAEQALNHKWFTEGDMKSTDGSGAAQLQSDKRMLLTNMLSFSQCRKMKQTALLSVALGISEEHIQQEMAAEVFHSMDQTKKGSLTRDEFCSALMECGVSNADAIELFSRINQSKSGNINFLEFMAAVMDQRDIGQSTIKEAFSILDGEKQGRLSIVGLQDVFKNSMVAEEVKEMIASVDTKGDGYVDFEAFQGLFTVPAPPLPQVVEEDMTTTASDTHHEGESLGKPCMVTSQSCRSTIDSTTDRTTPTSQDSPPISSSYQSGKAMDPATIKASLVNESDATVSMVNG
ncbi:hypothetical protein BBO99_00007436 [Phytophthora kernoviae]|uniref:non-specific serine/threonine protein kinase n=2 Tax=Phytophthora kernoviae TaxID=325452 RepID=A0A3R7J4G6_9STRA|nr:hypothetical protein G195_008402 [Phytophthora kernoviae 00238/432]KAG2519450.1 hypothetical protein JM16_007102 [Phytophthora kernoviae]KAG2520736.1 hypothetical protein JM18_006969 [Phytophthora kernoviae]RLN32291.1 hypothetical protein BBI17_007367 [Phytophthora kernoviae]RLN76590.1 hypothetical protein BBO99_00007436 [Phytophthora kernoviae]